jgi:hypothetical protein
LPRAKAADETVVQWITQLWIRTIRAWVLTLLRAITPLRPVPGEAAANVNEVIVELEEVNRTTERDFLAVGSKLLEFRGIARDISSELSQLTEAVSGEQGLRTARALEELLDESCAMDRRAEHTGQVLGRVQELAGRIPSAFSGLRARVLSFRTLCTLTRIETSRLGNLGTDFDGLADAVKPLSESIHLSGERILEHSAQLGERIREAIRCGAEVQNRHTAEVRSLIRNVGKSLGSLEQRRREAQDVSQRQAGQNRAICAAIDELVESVQFHDITRQQIEHVIEALRRLRGSIAQAGRPSAGENVVIQLQSSQLASAEHAFRSSVMRMQRALVDIGVQVRDMAESGGSFLASGCHDRESFFQEMESYCTPILEAIGICNRDSMQIGTVAADLTRSMGQMREALTEIEEIELQIQRIALNASIRAAQIDEAGSALNTIADAMSRLVAESRGNTREAIGALDAMSGALDGLSGPHNRCNGDDALTEFRSATAALRDSGIGSTSRMERIAILGSTLDASIQTVLREFRVGDRMTAAVAKGRAALDRVSAGESADSGTDPETAEQLQEFATRYTMQSERKVHEAVAGSPVTTAEEKHPVLAVGGDDLGDNVEFF